MATFTISIDLENDVFLPCPHDEIVRILRDVADRIDNGECPKSLFDINGNRVGTATVKKTRRSAKR